MSAEIPNKLKQLYFQVTIFMLILTLSVFVSLAWNVYKVKQQAYLSAEQSARISYKRDRALRHFLSRMGGVYLSRTDAANSKSFLKSFPNQEIFDLDSGTVLTLYDPASLIKLMQEDAADFYEIPVRIIGINALNPENSPTPEEKEILNYLTTNKEFMQMTDIENKRYLRLMKPLYTEPRCLKCHAAVGFKDGDFIGAVGVTVSMEPYLESSQKSKNQLLLTHIAIWLMGALGTGIYGSRLKKELKNELQLKAEIQDYQNELESKVEQRTLELSKFSRAMDNSPIMVIMTDINGVVEYINPSYTRVTGYAPMEIIGKNTSLMKSEQTVVRLYTELWQTISAGKTWTGELCNKRKDGSEYWVSASISPIFSHTGKIINYVALEEDISDKRLIQQELVLAREAAEKASQAKSEFLARMSHELRTPLNAIIGFAQLFEYAPDLDIRQKNNAIEIHKAGKHLLNLINHVLDLSKIEMGKIEMLPEVILVDSLIADCTHLLKPLTQENHVRLIFTNTRCNCHIYADYTHAKQVLINLLSNAIKYNTERGTVEIYCEAINSDYIRLNVKDSGIGIANEDLEELFEPYNRLNAKASGIEGSGIGLVITKQLIELMGGKIGVESKKNEGCIFWMELPVAHMEKPMQSESTLSLNKEVAIDQVQILYIEDDMANIRLMKQIVAMEEKWSLAIALSAEAGIRSVLSERPDIILMDINLPGMNGFEALELIKKDPHFKLLPIIAVSADAMKHDIDRALKAGFDAYITKPVNVAEIINKIYTFL